MYECTNIARLITSIYMFTNSSNPKVAAVDIVVGFVDGNSLGECTRYPMP